MRRPWIIPGLAVCACLCFVTCTGRRCEESRSAARQAWSRYLASQRAQLDGYLLQADARRKQLLHQRTRLDRLQACARRVEPSSPDIPRRCLEEAGLDRAPATDEQDLRETRAKLVEMQAFVDRLRLVEEAVRRMDCPAAQALEAARKVSSEAEDPLLDAARAASEQLAKACPDGQIPAAAACASPR